MFSTSLTLSLVLADIPTRLYYCTFSPLKIKCSIKKNGLLIHCDLGRVRGGLLKIVSPFIGYKIP